MATKIADDFAFIRARMAELRAEPEAEHPECATCESGGWVQVHSKHPPAFGVCQDCFNPWGYESP